MQIFGLIFFSSLSMLQVMIVMGATYLVGNAHQALIKPIDRSYVGPEKIRLEIGFIFQLLRELRIQHNSKFPLDAALLFLPFDVK